MKKYCLLFLVCLFPIYEIPEFVIMTPPHSGAHLLIPIVEELTGLKGLWPFQDFAPHKPCDQETFEALSQNSDYLAHLWNHLPVSKNLSH